MTQSELARELGISERALRAWEAGESLPDAHRADRLEEVLAVEEGSVLSRILRAKEEIDGDRRERALRLRREEAEDPFNPDDDEPATTGEPRRRRRKDPEAPGSERPTEGDLESRRKRARRKVEGLASCAAAAAAIAPAVA